MITARVLSGLVKVLVLAFFRAPCAQEQKGLYEKNGDVKDMIGGSSRPFLFLSCGATRSWRRGLFISACSCGHVMIVPCQLCLSEERGHRSVAEVQILFRLVLLTRCVDDTSFYQSIFSKLTIVYSGRCRAVTCQSVHFLNSCSLFCATP